MLTLRDWKIITNGEHEIIYGAAVNPAANSGLDAIKLNLKINNEIVFSGTSSLNILDKLEETIDDWISRIIILALKQLLEKN